MGTNGTLSLTTITARTIALVAAWAGLGTALGGCGRVTEGIPIDETATRIANTVCPKAYSCCTADQLAGNSSAGTDVTSCKMETRADYVNALSTMQASVNQGRATYQSSKVDACLATIMNSACATLNMTHHLKGVPGCDSFATPLVAPGGTCSQDYECINGWCNVPADSPDGQGTCAAFIATGQSCADSGGPGCGPNAVCDPEGTADSADDLCQPVSDVGGACADDLQCTSGNCSSSGGSGMTCQPPTTPPPAMCFYQSGCATAGGRPAAGTLLLFAALAALIAACRARRHR